MLIIAADLHAISRPRIEGVPTIVDRRVQIVPAPNRGPDLTFASFNHSVPQPRSFSGPASESVHLWLAWDAAKYQLAQHQPIRLRRPIYDTGRLLPASPCIPSSTTTWSSQTNGSSHSDYMCHSHRRIGTNEGAGQDIWRRFSRCNKATGMCHSYSPAFS